MFFQQEMNRKPGGFTDRHAIESRRATHRGEACRGVTEGEGSDTLNSQACEVRERRLNVFRPRRTQAARCPTRAPRRVGR